VDDASLVFGFWEQFSHRLQHTKALVPNDEFYSIQAAVAQPLKKADSAGLVLFYALTQNLSVSVLIDRNRHQNGHILKLSAPIAAQINPVHIDMGSARPARAGSASPQYGHTLSCSVH